MIAKVGDVNNDAVLLQTGDAIQNLKHRVGASSNHLKTKFEEMSYENLSKISNVVDGNNNELKYNTIKNILFKNESDSLNQKIKKVETIKKLMSYTVQYACAKGYANEVGELAWRGENPGTMKGDLEIVKKTRMKAEGKAEGRREAEQEFASAHADETTDADMPER